jgi:hypothetical protein
MMMSDREKRQWRLFKSRLSEYRPGTTGLNDLVGDIRALIWEFQEISEDQRERIQLRYFDLEHLVVVTVGRGVEPTEQDVRDISLAIARLAEFIPVEFDDEDASESSNES